MAPFNHHLLLFTITIITTVGSFSTSLPSRSSKAIIVTFITTSSSSPSSSPRQCTALSQFARVRRLPFKLIISCILFPLHLNAEVGDAPLQTAAQRGQWNKQRVVIRWVFSSRVSLRKLSNVCSDAVMCTSTLRRLQRVRCASRFIKSDPRRLEGVARTCLWTVLGWESVRICCFFFFFFFLHYIDCCWSRHSVPDDGHS